MTASEFKEEFNLRYNNALEGAPGLDTYEISTYLTIGQEQIVKKYYDVTKDPSISFESKEKARRSISELVKDEKILLQSDSSRGLFPESKMFEISGDIMYIVMETASLSNTDTLYNNKLIKVIPTTHDELMVHYRNPFRKSNKNKAWRVDLSREGGKTTVEIVSKEDLSRYNVRYVSFPNPIIIEDLSTALDVEGLGLTINGKTSQAGSLLPNLTHREIIDRAVELAVADYRDGTLQSRAQMNTRI
tara:strand:- start:1442 stop:2179 length:738 start_codon:yes stop_codon:yes gene_type:complete